MAEVHPTAIVDPSAELGNDNYIGPYTIIGPDVRIGNGNRIGSHVVIEGHTTLGDENQIYQFASVGAAPQDLKYHGEASTLEVGSKNIIREYVTLQPGTEGGGMRTTIGDQNLFMACSHVGHDSHIGSGNIFANSAAVSGHVEVGNYVIVGGLAGLHQFIRIADHAFIAAGSMVGKDIPPYCYAQGDRAGLAGLNIVGLERHGFSKDDIAGLKKLYRFIFMGDGTMKDRLESARSEYAGAPLALAFIEFVSDSERGVALPRKASE